MDRVERTPLGRRPGALLRRARPELAHIDPDSMEMVIAAMIRLYDREMIAQGLAPDLAHSVSDNVWRSV